MKQRFYLVDVFAERPYAGNQLAVVVGEQALADATMQLLAAETNYSETTFVSPLPARDGGYQVRIFTPAREIAFAGHPILGTAWVLRHLVSPGAPAPLQLNLSVGPINVTFEVTDHGQEVVWFLAPAVSLGRTCPSEPMAAALGVPPGSIDTASPIQQVSAGTSAMIVPLRSLHALRQCRLDPAAYAPLANDGFPPLIYLFCRETHLPGNDFCARFFFEANGMREDPATGNGAAFLGAYLMDHGLVPDPGFAVRIEQGHEVGRPSLILLRGQMAGGRREVHVGGSVILTVVGELA